MSKILLVEDDPRISGFVKQGLEAEGYVVDLAETGHAALAMARDIPYRLIILDRMLPGVDGLEVCRVLRLERRDSLILMLTAKGTLRDKIEGLTGGADDYLTKPFAFDELVARVGALLRRPANPIVDQILRVGDLTLDPASKKVSRGERTIILTAREFALLSYLMANASTVVSRTRLLNNVWEISFEPGTKVVDVYIRYLRRKVDRPGEKPLIKTMRGFGYMIEP